MGDWDHHCPRRLQEAGKYTTPGASMKRKMNATGEYNLLTSALDFYNPSCWFLVSTSQCRWECQAYSEGFNTVGKAEARVLTTGLHEGKGQTRPRNPKTKSVDQYHQMDIVSQCGLNTPFRTVQCLLVIYFVVYYLMNWFLYTRVNSWCCHFKDGDDDWI